MCENWWLEGNDKMGPLSSINPIYYLESSDEIPLEARPSYFSKKVRITRQFSYFIKFIGAKKISGSPQAQRTRRSCPCKLTQFEAI